MFFFDVVLELAQVGFLEFQTAVFFGIGTAALPDAGDDVPANVQRQIQQLPVCLAGRPNAGLHLFEDAVLDAGRRRHVLAGGRERRLLIFGQPVNDLLHDFFDQFFV